MYYWGFAIFASEYGALANELAVGIGFFTWAYIAYKLKIFLGLLLLSAGYVTRALYDILHDVFFINAGVPH